MCPLQSLAGPTGDDKTTGGGREAGFLGQTVNGTALVALEAILGANGADVKLARGKHQVFAICRARHTRQRLGTGRQHADMETSEQILVHAEVFMSALAGYSGPLLDLLSGGDRLEFSFYFFI